MHQFLTFQLSGGEYGLPILRVKEIIEYEAPTPVPNAPAVVRGLINLRGAVVPVIDLAVKLGVPRLPVTKRSCIVIVETDGELGYVGVAVDAVSQVIELAATDIAAPPEFGLPVKNDLLRGLGKMGRRFVLLLEAEKMFSGVELTQAAVPALAEPAGQAA
jgi:purine-binding chemotaxis protein CheW